MNPHCQCESSGYCQRHKMQKVGRMHELCRGTADTPDRGFKYWRAWEMGQLGATAPDDPVLERWMFFGLPVGPIPAAKAGRPRGVQKKRKSRPFQLGDRVEQALSLVGITEERVSAWLGRPCGCKERKRKLNQLGTWAARVLLGKTERAEEYLDQMVDDQ